MVFGGCRGHGKTFSNAASRTKALYDPEQPQLGQRGLSIEKRTALEGKQRAADPGSAGSWGSIAPFSNRDGGLFKRQQWCYS